jgi:hypothetical protein
MSLIVSKNDNDTPRTLVPEGPHVARCTAVIDLGTQTQEWKGETKQNKKVLISWEFPEITAVFNKEDGEQPLGRSLHYNASLHEKSTLRKHLAAWRGRQFTDKELGGFDLKNVLGVPCLATVMHKKKLDGSVTDRIDNISALPKGLPCPEAVNEAYCYSIENHPANWDRLPEWVKKQIEESPEYKQAAGTAPAPVNQEQEEETDACPF